MKCNDEDLKDDEIIEKMIQWTKDVLWSKGLSYPEGMVREITTKAIRSNSLTKEDMFRWFEFLGGKWRP